MVCGVKWKGCDCPWFNYEAVDVRLLGGNPVRYAEEMERRREQERRDEMLARRMEVLGVGVRGAERVGRQMEEQGQRQGAPEDVFVLGNAAGHHLNHNFRIVRNILTADYGNANRMANGLLNGDVTGRENPLPHMPDSPDRTHDVLRRGTVRRQRTAPTDYGDSGRRERRQSDDPVRNLVQPFFDGRSQTAEEREAEARVQNWASGIRPGAP